LTNPALTAAFNLTLEVAEPSLNRSLPDRPGNADDR
jgi:hypothetical protein